MVETLQEFQRSGSIRFLGATTYGEEEARVVLDDGRFDCIQIAYSVLDRTLENSVLPLAQSNDVGIIVRSVLLKGALTHRYEYLPSSMQELKTAVAGIRGIAESASATLPEIAYRFVLAHPAVSSALVGTASVEELQAAVEFSGRGPLAPECLTRLRQVTLSDPILLQPGKWPAEALAESAGKR
jgi:aryl-alcohol dehydrogenase-like predicted oxidoreductase